MGFQLPENSSSTVFCFWGFVYTCTVKLHLLHTHYRHENFLPTFWLKLILVFYFMSCINLAQSRLQKIVNKHLNLHCNSKMGEGEFCALKTFNNKEASMFWAPDWFLHSVDSLLICLFLLLLKKPLKVFLPTHAMGFLKFSRFPISLKLTSIFFEPPNILNKNLYSLLPPVLPPDYTCLAVYRTSSCFLARLRNWDKTVRGFVLICKNLCVLFLL